MSKALKLSLLALFLCFLTACGGGSSNDNENADDQTTGEMDDDSGDDNNDDMTDDSGDDNSDDMTNDSENQNDGDNDGQNSADAVANIQPITPLTSSTSTTVLGTTITGAAGSQGDINTAIVDSDLMITLTNASMNVVDVKRTQAFSGNCDNGFSGTVVLDIDYQTGIETLTANVDGENFSCTNTYNTVLPTTIAGEASIIALLIEYGEDDPISTTCPTDESVEEIIDVPDTVECSTEILSNFRVTDDNSTEHLISTKQGFQ